MTGAASRLEIVSPLTYERFLVRLLKMVTSGPSVETRKAVVTALIHRIHIHEKGFKLGYYIGSGQIKTGEAVASPAKSFGNIFLSESSLLLQNGRPRGTRTPDQSVMSGLL